ncbi:MAG: hypothetical protein ABH879_09170 [archaeon]
MKNRLVWIMAILALLVIAGSAAEALDFRTTVSEARSNYISKERVVSYLAVFAVLFMLGLFFLKDKFSGGQQYFAYLVMFGLAVAVTIALSKNPHDYIWEGARIQWLFLCPGFTVKPLVNAFVIGFFFVLIYEFGLKNLGSNSGGSDNMRYAIWIVALILGVVFAHGIHVPTGDTCSENVYVWDRGSFYRIEQFLLGARMSESISGGHYGMYMPGDKNYQDSRAHASDFIAYNERMAGVLPPVKDVSQWDDKYRFGILHKHNLAAFFMAFIILFLVFKFTKVDFSGGGGFGGSGSGIFNLNYFIPGYIAAMLINQGTTYDQVITYGYYVLLFTLYFKFKDSLGGGKHPMLAGGLAYAIAESLKALITGDDPNFFWYFLVGMVGGWLIDQWQEDKGIIGEYKKRLNDPAGQKKVLGSLLLALWPKKWAKELREKISKWKKADKNAVSIDEQNANALGTFTAHGTAVMTEERQGIEAAIAQAVQAHPGIGLKNLKGEDFNGLIEQVINNPTHHTSALVLENEVVEIIADKLHLSDIQKHAYGDNTNPLYEHVTKPVTQRIMNIQRKSFEFAKRMEDINLFTGLEDQELAELEQQLAQTQAGIAQAQAALQPVVGQGVQQAPGQPAPAQPAQPIVAPTRQNIQNQVQLLQQQIAAKQQELDATQYAIEKRWKQQEKDQLEARLAQLRAQGGS